MARHAFRRHVVGRADDRPGGREDGRLADRRDTEVGEHRTAVGTQENVGRFHIAVLDADLVRRAQGGQHLASDQRRFTGFHRSAGETIGQGTAGDEFHDDPGVGLRAVVHNVMDRHHVGVTDLSQGASLPQDPLPKHPRGFRIIFGEVRIGRPDLFDGHAPVQHQIPGQPDHAHTATAEPLLQLEPSVDNPSAAVVAGRIAHGREHSRRR